MSLVRLDYELAARASKVLDDILILQAGGSAQAEERTLPPELVSRFMGLPAMLHTSGLPATLAFFYAKATGKTSLAAAYETARTALVKEILRELGPDTDAPPEDALAFFDRLGDPARTSPGDLARITAHIEEFAVWLRRLTEAI